LADKIKEREKARQIYDLQYKAGDAIDVRIRTKLDEADTYKTTWQQSYSDVQPEDGQVIRLPAMPDTFGLEVSMRQTAGTLKYILCEFFDAKQ